MKILKMVFFTFFLTLVTLSSAALSAYYFLPQAPTLEHREEDDSLLPEDQTYNILMCGVDAGHDNADTILLISFNPSKQTVKVLSVPRDTMSNVPRSLKKINASYCENGPDDIEQTKKEVSMLTSIEIDRHVITTFEAFEHAIDAIGGVKMNVPEDLYYIDPYQGLEINLKAGEQVLNGKQALQFVRYRSGYSEGDLGRIKAQKIFFKALGRTLMNPANVTKIPALADVIKKDMLTDLTVPEMLWFAKKAKGMDLKQNVSIFMLPGYPEYVNEVSYYIPCESAIVNMVNKEFKAHAPITESNLDLVPLAKEVTAAYGYGSEKNKDDPDKEPDTAAQEQGQAPMPSPATGVTYGYGGAYTPPLEYNTNLPARSYTTIEQPKHAAVPPTNPEPTVAETAEHTEASQ